MRTAITRGRAARATCAPSRAAPLLRRRFGAGRADRDAAVRRDAAASATSTLSFHPAGHVLGSAQIRIEGPDGVWVVAGDYKRAADPTCAPFEPVRCDTFITESTFGLPIYRWDPTGAVIADIARLVARATATPGRTSVLFCYTLGKAQRLLAELAARDGPRVLDPRHDARR